VTTSAIPAKVTTSALRHVLVKIVNDKTMDLPSLPSPRAVGTPGSSQQAVQGLPAAQAVGVDGVLRKPGCRICGLQQHRRHHRRHTAAAVAATPRFVPHSPLDPTAATCEYPGVASEYAGAPSHTPRFPSNSPGPLKDMPGPTGTPRLPANTPTGLPSMILGFRRTTPELLQVSNMRRARSTTPRRPLDTRRRGCRCRRYSKAQWLGQRSITDFCGGRVGSATHDVRGYIGVHMLAMRLSWNFRCHRDCASYPRLPIAQFCCFLAVTAVCPGQS
jgi:hypothetical protein